MPNGQMRFNPSPLVRHRASIRGDRNGLAGGCPSTGQPLIMLLNLIVLFVHHSSNTTFPGGFLGLRTRPLGRRGATRPRYLLNHNNAGFRQPHGLGVLPSSGAVAGRDLARPRNVLVRIGWSSGLPRHRDQDVDNLVLLQPCSDKCPWASGKSMVARPSVA
jgi:hypothetical protein